MLLPRSPLPQFSLPTNTSTGHGIRVFLRTPPERGREPYRKWDEIDPLKILPGVTHWQGPNYFAYFPSNSSIAGFLGEMLSAGLNIVGFSWITSPAATELEMIVLDWVAKAFQLPDHFYSTGQGGGVIQGTASEAILVVLLAARDKILRRVGKSALPKLVMYASDQFLVQLVHTIPYSRAQNHKIFMTLRVCLDTLKKSYFELKPWFGKKSSKHSKIFPNHDFELKPWFCKNHPNTSNFLKPRF